MSHNPQEIPLDDEHAYLAHEVFDEADTADDAVCPECGSYWVWDGKTEASRTCPSCRIEAAQRLYEDRYNSFP